MKDEVWKYSYLLNDLLSLHRNAIKLITGENRLRAASLNQNDKHYFLMSNKSNQIPRQHVNFFSKWIGSISHNTYVLDNERGL